MAGHLWGPISAGPSFPQGSQWLDHTSPKRQIGRGHCWPVCRTAVPSRAGELGMGLVPSEQVDGSQLIEELRGRVVEGEIGLVGEASRPSRLAE